MTEETEKKYKVLSEMEKQISKGYLGGVSEDNHGDFLKAIAIGIKYLVEKTK